MAKNSVTYFMDGPQLTFSCRRDKGMTTNKHTKSYMYTTETGASNDFQRLPKFSFNGASIYRLSYK